jgi:ABC-type proline/glycine betaine transport system permease subunit
MMMAVTPLCHLVLTGFALFGNSPTGTRYGIFFGSWSVLPTMLRISFSIAFAADFGLGIGTTTLGQTINMGLQLSQLDSILLGDLIHLVTRTTLIGVVILIVLATVYLIAFTVLKARREDHNKCQHDSDISFD